MRRRVKPANSALAFWLGITLALELIILFTGDLSIFLQIFPGITAGSGFICGLLAGPTLASLDGKRVYLEEDIEEEDIGID